MAELLLDTDVFVDHLRQTQAIDPRTDNLSYSTVTRAELFAGRRDHEPAVRALLAPLREHPVDRSIAERAGVIRRETGVALPDSLIAGTALVHGLTLVTRNKRHFERVRHLRIRGPA